MDTRNAVLKMFIICCASEAKNRSQKPHKSQVRTVKVMPLEGIAGRGATEGMC